MKTLNFITGNKNKLSEVRAILGDAIVIDNKSVDVPEIQGTIEEIAKEKCRRAADVVCMLLADSVYINGPCDDP
jgi:inosine triphosphate pyrophosphatase